jgi:phosphoglycolate phosphatase-like HAD superfamily hydrolase
MKYLLYIFDLDGTIIDSRGSIISALYDTLDFFNLPKINSEKGKLYIGHTLEDILRNIGVEDIERGRQVYREAYYRYIKGEKPFPGINELLKNLKSRVLLSISTNKGSNGTRVTLENNGILDYFDTIESVDTAKAKPHRESFDKILRFYASQGKKLEVSDCLIVGDSPTDCEFAHNCGADFAFVEWGFFTRDTLPFEPTYSVNRADELFLINDEAVEIEIEEEIDLHNFKPKEVKILVEAYLVEANKRGFKSVRIIHGKGKGVQREIVRGILAKTDFVDNYYDAPYYIGGRGATIAELKT